MSLDGRDFTRSCGSASAGADAAFPDRHTRAGDFVRPLRGLPGPGGDALQEDLPESGGSLSKWQGFPLDGPAGPRGPHDDSRAHRRRGESGPAETPLPARGVVVVRDTRDLGGFLAAADEQHRPPAPGRRSGSLDQRRNRRLRLAVTDVAPIRLSLVGLLLVLAALSSGWQVLQEYRAVAGLPAAPSGARNVVLIVWDTVRSNNLSIADYARDTTPHLKRWARRGHVPPRGARSLDVSLAYLLLHRPVALRAQYPVEVPPGYAPADPGRVPGLTRLSDRRVRGKHQLL